MSVTIGSLSLDYETWPVYSVAHELEQCQANGLDPSPFLGKTNSFSSTIGPEPGTGWLLMSQADVDSIRETDQQFLTLTLGIQDDNNEVVPELSGFRYQVFPAVTIIRADRVYSGSPEDDDNNLMLVEIADRRWYLRQRLINRSYNMEPLLGASVPEDEDDNPHDYDPVTLRQPSSGAEDCRPWTWREILQDIWCYIHGGTVNTESWNTFPTLPVDYSTDNWDAVPQRVWCHGMSALNAFSECLWRFGGAILCYDPIEDLFRIEFHNRFNSTVDSYRELLEPFQLRISSSRLSDLAAIPESVQVGMTVRFSAFDQDFRNFPWFFQKFTAADYMAERFGDDAFDTSEGTEAIIHSWYDLTADGASLTSEVTGSSCTVAGGLCARSFLLRSQLPETHDLYTSLKEIAYRYYDSLVESSFPEHEIWQGVMPFVPCSNIQKVIWISGPDGTKTHLFFNRMLTPFVSERLHIPRESGGGGTPIIMFQVLDFVNPTEFYENCGLAIARCRVLSRPVGMSSVPGEDSERRVYVYDMTFSPDSGGGCFFNEPPENLIDRIGFAAYLESAGGDACSTNEPRQWHVFSLCCLTETCGPQTP